MRTLLLAVAVFLVGPALWAQQGETRETPPQAAPHVTSEPSDVQNALPEAIRRGHPLDPADVEILTGKKDREIEASRRVSLAVSAYSAYSGAYAMDGRSGRMLDLPLLPLRRIENPFFFLNIQTRGFGRGFRGGHLR